MVGSLLRLAAAVSFSLVLAACASTPAVYSPDSSAPVSSARVETPATPLQCVPYARSRSGIPIYGDAGTWWDKAGGHYVRGSSPVLGSVMVLTGYAGPGRAHLAVVASQVSERIITVDHANWLDDGAIYRDDPVADVSPDNDWSEVRIYNARAQAWGVRTYLVKGFIGPGPDSENQRVASTE
ncbi:MAG: CHAP domain-containing protein [Rhizomicrobium sp.]|jgi:surface antigen